MNLDALAALLEIYTEQVDILSDPKTAPVDKQKIKTELINSLNNLKQHLISKYGNASVGNS